MGRDFPALGFDPAPGDIHAVQSVADAFTSGGKAVSSAQDAMTGVHLNGVWSGQQADAAQQQIDALGKRIGDHRSTLDNAGKVLGQWAGDLSGLQSTAAKLESEAEQAQQKLQAAESNQDLKLAGQTFTNQADAQAAQQRYQTAVADKQSAQQALDGIKQQAQQLAQQHKQAVDAVVQALKGKPGQPPATKPSSTTPPAAPPPGAPAQPPGKPVPGQPIDQSQVTYNGKGQYNSGQDAVSAYIDQALTAKGITDPTARQNWKNGLMTIASRESAYNSPDWQVNNYDQNNTGPVQSDGSRANCSRGGWQVTPTNFAQYHQPGTSNDIYDPVANAAAAINYIQATYHVSDDGSNLAANVQQADPSRPAQGY